MTVRFVNGSYLEWYDPTSEYNKTCPSDVLTNKLRIHVSVTSTLDPPAMLKFGQIGNCLQWTVRRVYWRFLIQVRSESINQLNPLLPCS